MLTDQAKDLSVLRVRETQTDVIALEQLDVVFGRLKRQLKIKL